MTNPDNAVGTNGAFGGRTSVNAFNDVMAAFTGRGIISGWGISPSSGMTVAIGGDGVNRDVAVAEDNAGNKTSVNNISQAPISLAVMAAPATNNRIDAIVAYVDNPPSGASTVVDNYGACGLIDVPGTVSASPSAPDESAIRTAITTDGGAGATAYYVVIGYVTIAAGTTDITSDMIEAGPYAQIGTNQISDGSVTSDKIDWTTLDKVDIITGGITLSSTTETILPLLTMNISDSRRPAAGNGVVFNVSLSNNTVTLRKDAAFKVYGGVVPTTHGSGNIKIEVKINGTSVIYARQPITAYQTLLFHTPAIMGKQDDVITLTVQDTAGDAAFTNNTYGLNWVTFEQIG